MQIECSISITSNDGLKHYLQRDSPIIIYDSYGYKVFDGKLKGVSFTLESVGAKNSSIEIVGIATYDESKKTLCSISIDEIEKIEVIDNTFNLYVKYFSTVIY